MNDTAVEQFTHYADQMFLNVADELNVKQVRLELQGFNKPVSIVYHYDTIRGDSRGFTVERDGKTAEAPKTLLVGLTAFFSGNVIEDMQKVRDIVSEGLKQRNQAGIKVRQPLSKVSIPISLPSKEKP